MIHPAKNMKIRLRTIVAASAACILLGCTHKLPWYLDYGRLRTSYLAAMEDARTTEPGKVRCELPVITVPGEDSRIQWLYAEGCDFVLVCSMTGNMYADEWREGRDFRTGDYVSWVVLPYQLRQRIAQQPEMADSLECCMRLLQMLGLPPDCTHDRLIFFYTERDKLMRPTPDPAISRCEISSKFPDGTPPAYKEWFSANAEKSYCSDTPYPWTRAGYTYDWHEGSGNGTGLGEFIVPPGTRVIVKEQTTVWSWYRQSITGTAIDPTARP